MPCWILGVMAYYYRDRWPLSKFKVFFVAFLLPLIFAIVLNKLAFGESTRGVIKNFLGSNYDAFSFSNYFLVDYVTAFIVSLKIYAMRYIKIYWSNLIESVIKTGASMSFTLYLLHLPLIFLLEKYTSNIKNILFFVLSISSILLVSWFISTLTEQKRPLLKILISNTLKKFENKI